MSNQAILKIRFLDWWHAGTGASGAGDADMITYRDSFDCPALPMTQVKGTLRETAERFWDAADVVKYFGESSKRAETEEPVDHVEQGGILFSGAMTVSPAEGAWFADNAEERGQLFGLLYSTAINDNTGTAKSKTLRQIEAAIPMELTATLGLRDQALSKDWIEKLAEICALTPAFGKLKNDGYGRAIASCCAVESGV